MELTIDVESPIPVYEQIRAQITELVESDLLAANAPLPSVRQLAADLQIAPGTVARAYRELEAGGVVFCSRWAGTHVANVAPVAHVERKRRLEETVTRMVAAARRLGARDEEIKAAIARALARANSRR